MRASLLPKPHRRFFRFHEGLQQAKFRVGVVIAVYAVAVWANRSASDNLHLVESPHLIACIGYLGVSIAVLWAFELLARFRPTDNEHVGVVLCKGMLLGDGFALTYFGMESGEAALAIAPVAITYVIGNGFRFGKQYFIAAQALITIGTLLVFYRNAAVSSHPIAVTAYLIALGLIPGYAIVLLNRHTSLIKELSKVSSEREALLKLLSHEIRSPLFNIGALAKSITTSADTVELRDQAATDIRARAETISEICFAINELCENTLDCLNRYDGGVSPAFKQTENVFELLRQVAEEYYWIAESKQIELTWSIHSEVDPYIRTQSGFLRTALENLVENAIKHNRAVVVHISALPGSKSANERMLLIRVSAAPYPDDFFQRRTPREVADVSPQKRAFGFGVEALKYEINMLGGAIVETCVSRTNSRFSFEIPYIMPLPTQYRKFGWGYCLYCGPDLTADDLSFWSDAGYVLRSLHGESRLALRDIDQQVDVIACGSADIAKIIRQQARATHGPKSLPPIILIANEPINGIIDTCTDSANYVVARSVTKPSTVAAFRKQVVSFSGPNPLQGLRILIVDDVPLITSQLAEILSIAGADTTQAHNESDALREIQRARFDCLVVDAEIGTTQGRVIAEKYRSIIRGPCIVVLLSGAIKDASAESLYDVVLSKGSAVKSIVSKMSNAYAKANRAQYQPSLAPSASEAHTFVRSDLTLPDVERSYQQILIELNQMLFYLDRQHDSAQAERQRHLLRGLVDVVLGQNAYYCRQDLEGIITPSARPDFFLLKRFEVRLREVLGT
ncbi:MAG: hybrid sensor histidine kinase/response regulator [Gammaproteobacteria bacterium]